MQTVIWREDLMMTTLKTILRRVLVGSLAIGDRADGKRYVRRNLRVRKLRLRQHREFNGE